MELVHSLPIWALALAIFVLRIVDVSLGTIRTLAIVEGRVKLAVVLGFLEVFIWITVVAQVIVRVHESFIVLLAFAAGFAAGNAVGILLDKQLALGVAILRILSVCDGEKVAEVLRETGQRVTTFAGQGRDGPVTLLYVACPRRRLDRLVKKARQVDPDLIYAVERTAAFAPARKSVCSVSSWRRLANTSERAPCRPNAANQTDFETTTVWRV